MKFENLLKKAYVRYTAYGIAALVMATLLIGTPFFNNVSAQKGGGSTSDTGKPSGDQRTLEAARAVVRDALASGKYDEMSSAKQRALLLKARYRLEDGVLKEDEYIIPNVYGSKISNQDRDLSPLAPLANPLVNNPAADATAQKTQSETTIVLTGANTAVAGFNDSGSFLGGVNSFTGYSTSTDMGSIWTDRGIVPLLGQQNFGDPVLARNNTTGTVFLATLSGGAFGMNIYRSTDGGVTFSSVADGAPGAVSDGTDKEWITVDNFAGAGNGNVYHVYRDFGAPNGIFLTRSTNDGVSYSAPISIASGAAGNVQGAWVHVGPDHAVYAGFYDSRGTPDTIKIRKSTDLGLTFGAEVTVSNLVTTGTNGSLNIPAGYRSSAFPQFFENPVNANIIYVVHPDITVAGGTDSNIFFQQSADGGATWSANVRLNTDAGTNAQSQPTIAVTPDGTALCVTWQDSRNDAANRRVQRFGVIGTISGATVTFGPNFAVSQPSWTPVFGVDPVVNTVYMGDYDQMDADNSFFYSTFVDCRLGDQDVRFAKIPKAGPGAIIDFSSSNPSFLATATSTCNDLFVTLANNGTATATGVSATFTTATPGVTLQNATQNYGNIAAGATATNATPIRLSISNTFVCGATIVINVTVSTGEMFSFNIGTQGLGYQTTTMTGQAIVPGTVNVGNSGDDVTTNITIPFTFSFYGTGFTSANVSSNGNLQFTSNNAAFTNVCPLPTATMNNLIAPHWDDLRTDGTGGGIFTSISGSAPNRIFNIEWRAIYFGTTTSINFEMRLFETTGQIDFIYGTLNGTGSSATVGIQKGTGAGGASDFTQFSCNAATLSAGLKVSFNLLTNCPTGTGACATSNPAPTIINEVEPNGTPGTAQVLTGAENCFIVQGAVTPPGDLDFYRVNNVPAGARAWFYTDTGGDLVAGTRDSFIDVLAADGTTVIEADDDDGTGNGGDVTTESGFASSIAGRTLTAGGTYYFRVRGFGAFPGTNVVNPYRMFLVITNTAAVPEVEPNGTAATANTLVTAAQPTGVASGSISSAAEVDFYSVAATAGNILFISMDGDPTRTGVNTLDGVVSLIDRDGTTVLIAADSGFGGANNSEAFDFNISTTGTYFVRVAGFSTESGRAYNLMVSACQGVQAQPCVLTCPANITVSTALNQCSAVVTYPAPTSTGNCGTITCTPPSGSTFQRGTTTVTCTSSGTAAAREAVKSEQLAQVADDRFLAPVGFTGSSIAALPLASRLLQVKGRSDTPTASSGAVGRTSAPTAPQSPFAVLYSQLDNPAATATGSQNFEAAFDAFDDEVADDFVVPGGQTWTINQVFVDGLYFNGAGPATSVNVVFYNESSTLPGSVVATRATQTIATDTAGDFLINISPTVVLAPGTYWVEVQANQNFGTSGQWGWIDRTTTSGSGSAWRNPGGGFAVGCSPNFGRKTTCIAGSAPDACFQILGTSAPIGGGSTCTFTVTVNDTQPPSILCPPNISAVLPNPGANCVAVTYCPPTVTDNCPMATFACVPPSGSCLPPGTTTVTCTATDMSGNTATCSFTVTVFNICIQDDSNPNNVLLFITSGPETGDYRFCCGGAAPRTGRGIVKQIGSSYTLSHQPPNRRVQATFNIDTTSTASLQEPAGTIICTLTDRPTVGIKTCICGSPGQGCNSSGPTAEK